MVALFNPRADDWSKHFAFTKRRRIVGRSPIGRATIEALGMNREAAIEIRHELDLLGRFPGNVE